MTKAQERKAKESDLASDIRGAADALIAAIAMAKMAGLDVDCNAGTRYWHSIGGYVRIHRLTHNGTRATRIMDIELLSKQSKGSQS